MQDPNWDSTQNDDAAVPLPEENFDSTAEESSTATSTTTSGTSSTNGDDTAFQALQTELESSKAKLAELTNISQQALADLQNFKKRSEEEKSKFLSFANASLISELLPVLDNIERALTHIPEDPTAKEWAQGILATTKQLEQALTSKGLEPIVSLGETFNPNLHEALMMEAGPVDLILRELEKGYKIGDRILRRAKVVVGNGEIVI